LAGQSPDHQVLARHLGAGLVWFRHHSAPTDLGFWFAQQGSILVFLGLIFFYAWRMNKLDREFDVDEQ
jgi:putative solute:sodium symporter small subunit